MRRARERNSMRSQARILQLAARGLIRAGNYPGILQQSRSREDSGHLRPRRERDQRNADHLRLHHSLQKCRFSRRHSKRARIGNWPPRSPKRKRPVFAQLPENLSFDVAFIQMVVTPTGRQITFIANRPLQSDEVNPNPDSQSFDLMVGQFDINDTDNTKSTGFLYPASKLVIDEQGEFHYDLAGNPWSLVNVLDSNWAPALAAREAPKATGPPLQQSLP